LFHIKSDIAIGLAIGASSHVLGTSSCIEKHKEKQVVMATLALIIIGILTTVICVFVF
jgi:putative effector of murein hydrolase